MSDTQRETTSIHGSWPLDRYRWKTEQVRLMDKFLDGLGSKKLLGLECPGCGLVYLPPKLVCRCLSRPEKWVEVSGEGVVTTFTFTGAWSLDGKPEGEGESLIVVGVKMDGSDTMMVSMLQGAEAGEVDVGMRVKLKWPESPEGKLKDILYVEPA